MRGCIGTLTEAAHEKLGDFALKRCVSRCPLSNRSDQAPVYGYLRFAMLSSAFHDHRFNPLQATELPDLHCGVSLLVNYTKAKSWNDWEIGKHGIIIDFTVRGSQFSATFLPEVALEQGE